MNFPAPPPSLHDQLLYAQTGSTSSSAARPQHQQIPQQQQQQSQQQQQQLAQSQVFAMNGINGNMPGAMVGLPTPAGHQAELNYIYGMVEELSRQLAENQRTLEEVVSGVGRVRSRARTQAIGNDDLINAATDDVKGVFPPIHPSIHPSPSTPPPPPSFSSLTLLEKKQPKNTTSTP
jgi:hypothetical protein